MKILTIKTMVTTSMQQDQLSDMPNLLSSNTPPIVLLQVHELNLAVLVGKHFTKGSTMCGSRNGHLWKIHTLCELKNMIHVAGWKGFFLQIYINTLTMSVKLPVWKQILEEMYKGNYYIRVTRQQMPRPSIQLHFDGS